MKVHVHSDNSIKDNSVSNYQSIEPMTEVAKSKNVFQKFKQSFGKNLGENLLLVATVLAVILGIALGFILRSFATFNKNEIKYFSFMGELFLRMLKFLILPLIGSSLICGIAGLGSGNGGKIALRALVYYFLSTFLAVVIGIILVISIKPGKGQSGADINDDTLPVDTSRIVTTHDTILDLIRFYITLFM